jgi:hypothetical protein
MLSQLSATISSGLTQQKSLLRLKRARSGLNVAAMKNAVLIILLFLAASAVQAQTAGVVTLRANSTSATGSMAPVLTWSTNPVATSCTASGGWSGSKSVSGTQTLPTITASTNYTLTCSWGAGSARVSWVAPATNTDGSALQNLAGFRVYYGTSTGALTSSTTINDVTARAATISSLSSGTWYFAVRAVNSSQSESANSNIASKAISGASSASSTVAVTITAAPNPTPTERLTIATAVYDVIRGSNGSWTRGRVVGTIPIGRPCRTYYLSGDYYGVWTGRVTITRTPRGTTLVARCAFP